jgi:hypothetical protein
MGATQVKSLLRMAAVAVGIVVASNAESKDYGHYHNTTPDLRKWIEGLRDNSGQSCCDTADGHPAEYEWDFDGNGYRVRIEGEWYKVPPEAVINEPNKLGHATVWYWWSWDLTGNKTHHVRCFLPGPGG